MFQFNIFKIAAILPRILKTINAQAFEQETSQ
jgi:hypothetical protein